MHAGPLVDISSCGVTLRGRVFWLDSGQSRSFVFWFASKGKFQSSQGSFKYTSNDGNDSMDLRLDPVDMTAASLGALLQFLSILAFWILDFRTLQPFPFVVHCTNQW